METLRLEGEGDESQCCPYSTNRQVTEPSLMEARLRSLHPVRAQVRMSCVPSLSSLSSDEACSREEDDVQPRSSLGASAAGCSRLDCSASARCCCYSHWRNLASSGVDCRSGDDGDRLDLDRVAAAFHETLPELDWAGEEDAGHCAAVIAANKERTEAGDEAEEDDRLWVYVPVAQREIGLGWDTDCLVGGSSDGEMQ